MDDDVPDVWGKSIAAAVTAIGVISWAFAQPLLPFASPNGLWLWGRIMAFGVGGVYFALLMPRGYWIMAISMAVFLAGQFGLSNVAIAASRRAAHRERVCAKLEWGMLYAPTVLNGRKRRTDIPELYQALGCGPRG